MKTLILAKYQEWDLFFSRRLKRDSELNKKITTNPNHWLKIVLINFSNKLQILNLKKLFLKCV